MSASVYEQLGLTPFINAARSVSRLAGVRVLLAVVTLVAVILAAQLSARGPAGVGTAREAPVPTTIQITPHVESVLERSQAQQFTAIVSDQYGDPLPTVRVTWSVAPRVGTISQTGLFVATAECLRWDGIALVIAGWEPEALGPRPLRDGALVAIKHDPRCLPE